MMGFGGFGMLGGLGMSFGMIIWIVLIALAIWALVAHFDTARTRSVELPLASLKRRYARGEIGRAEFVQAKDDVV